MGWLPHEWNINCSPVKVLEYLALGKPVISSSAIDELEKYAPFVQVTPKPEEFVVALRDALIQNSAELVNARLDFVRKFSWEAHMQAILQALDGRTDR